MMFRKRFIHIQKRILFSLGFGLFAWSPPAKATTLPVGEAVPPPIGYIRFCLLNPADCRTTPDASRTMTLNSWRWAELQAIHTRINRDIRPRSDDRSRDQTQDSWDYPVHGYGDCEDYALAKRQALLRRGWPQHALRLVTARTETGEPHVVLAVTTGDGDFILDNRQAEIKRWDAVAYQWIALQDRDNPLRWHAARAVETSVASLGE